MYCVTINGWKCFDLPVIYKLSESMIFKENFLDKQNDKDIIIYYKEKVDTFENFFYNYFILIGIVKK